MSDIKILLLKLDELGVRLCKLEGKSLEELQKILISQEVYNTMNLFLKSINCNIDSSYTINRRRFRRSRYLRDK